MLYTWLVAACWLVFVAYWGISALSAKRTIGNDYGRLLWWRLGAVMIALLVLNFSGIRITSVYHPSDVLGTIGVLCAALGIGFAIWARVHLASNWGMPMSVKENPELVTSGPYAHVRHPIYTGVLLAMVGSALVSGPLWTVILIVACSYFVYAATQEEKLMLKEFPEQYPAYRERTKMLIPYIF